MVAAGEQAGAGRRAQRGGVEVGVAATVGGERGRRRAWRCRSRSSRTGRSRRRRAARSRRSARHRRARSAAAATSPRTRRSVRPTTPSNSGLGMLMDRIVASVVSVRGTPASPYGGAPAHRGWSGDDDPARGRRRPGRARRRRGGRRRLRQPGPAVGAEPARLRPRRAGVRPRRRHPRAGRGRRLRRRRPRRRQRTPTSSASSSPTTPSRRCRSARDRRAAWSWPAATRSPSTASTRRATSAWSRPRMLGPEVRRCYEEGVGFITAVGVHHDVTGTARARTLAVAKAIGGLRQGAIEMTAHQEAVLDLAVEQALSPALRRVTPVVRAGDARARHPARGGPHRAVPLGRGRAHLPAAAHRGLRRPDGAPLAGQPVRPAVAAGPTSTHLDVPTTMREIVDGIASGALRRRVARRARRPASPPSSA